MKQSWKSVRLKDYAQVLLSNIDKKTYENEQPVLLCNYTDVYYNKTIHKDIIFMPATASDAQIKKLTLQYNDVIITKDSESADDIGISAIVKYTAPNLVCGYHLAVIRSKKLDGNYINYLFQSKVAKDYFLEVCLGFTRVSLNKGDILNFTFNMPPFDEQIAIANYLDIETTKIDRKIEILEQKFEKLEGYKQSIIFETVTKSLHSNIPMKDSGIEWIGEIPEHWEVKRVKDLYTLKKGKNSGLYSADFIHDKSNKGAYPVYSGQTENEGIMGSIKTFEYDFPNGVIFTTTVGAKAMSVKKLLGKFSLSQNCGLLIPTKSIDLSYSYYFISICFSFARQSIPSHMQPSLRKEDLNIFYCLDIPPKEQREISAYLNSICSKIDRKKQIIEKQIELLKEYKQAIIFEAVTGKMDIL